MATRYIIQTLDGRRYGGATLRSAFERVRADAWGYIAPGASLDALPSAPQYMRIVAARMAEWNKSIIDASSIKTFCAGMVAAGQWQVETIADEEVAS